MCDEICVPRLNGADFGGERPKHVAHGEQPARGFRGHPRGNVREGSTFGVEVQFARECGTGRGAGGGGSPHVGSESRLFGRERLCLGRVAPAQGGVNFGLIRERRA